MASVDNAFMSLNESSEIKVTLTEGVAPPAWTLDDVAATFKACEGLFHALGDPGRQAIILLLAQHERLNVTQITEAMHLSRPAVSHHLKVLKDAGMVAMTRESRENFYSLLWDEPIGRLKRLIEQAEVACA